MRKKRFYEPLVEGIDNLMRMVLHTIEGLEERMLEVEARLGIERRCEDNATGTARTAKALYEGKMAIRSGYREEGWQQINTIIENAKKEGVEDFEVDVDKGLEYAVADVMCRLDKLLDGDFKFTLNSPAPTEVLDFNDWLQVAWYPKEPTSATEQA